jgi:dihydrofolate synthase/folylpolyglutamate synthase
LEDYFPGQEVVLVFGASEDKDITGMLTELKPGINQVVATKSTHPRAADPDQLVSIANKLSLPAISTESVEEAMDEAEQLSDGKKIILVTGSIFVAAAARSVRLLSESESDTVLIGK